MPATPDTLDFRYGPGMITVDREGVIRGVVHDSRPGASYLLEAGTVTVRSAGGQVPFELTGWHADSDEVEVVWEAAGLLRLEVRHTFAAGWGMRLAVTNIGTTALTLDDVQLALVAGEKYVPWGLAAGAEAAYSLHPLDGAGPVLGGLLKLGSVQRLGPGGARGSRPPRSQHSPGVASLGTIDLAPGGRYILVWQWSWYPTPRALGAGRHPGVPVSTYLVAGQSARIHAGSDVAVLAPDPHLVVAPDGESTELIPSGPGDYPVELRSALGAVEYRLHCAAPAENLLARLADRLLGGSRTPAGVIRIDTAAAGLVVQHAIASGIEQTDAAAEALDLLTSRLRTAPARDPLSAAYLCGEAVRIDEAELIDVVAEAMRAAELAEPGLGLAVLRLSVSSLVLGRDISRVLDGLLGLVVPSATDAEPADADAALRRDIGRLELMAVLASSRRQAPQPDLIDHVARIGVWLGAGLKGEPVRRLGLVRLAQLAAVLELLPEQLEPAFHRRWPCPPSELAHRARAELLNRLQRVLADGSGELAAGQREGLTAAAWLALAQPSPA
jgi:hypothetical protein